MEIFSLEEGIYSVDKEKNLTLLTEVNDQPVPKFIRMAIRPFLIKLKTDIVLLDCGLGTEDNGDFMITSLLKQHKTEPGQVTKILLSHLHKDHIEGLGYFRGGSFIQHFPDAAIYVNKQELEYSLSQKGSPSFNYDLLLQLAALPNLHVMTESQGHITPEIAYKVVGGHSPYHQVFWVSEADETIFYGGDNLPQAHYLDFHIAYKSDYNGRVAMELRQKWEQQAKNDHWTILLYHDLKLPVSRY